ncbi:uncharacterized protein LOC135942940 [Cloeon dipterum]|uniref:uncharacterized protein LOC135942940 n=1 Tax=Cloeon dipterum TaxID=197152 RepID=UPI00321FD4FA
MLPPVVLLFCLAAIGGSDGQFICSSNTELLAQVNSTLLKRMDDAELNLAAEMRQVLAKVESLEGTFALSRDEEKSVQSANSVKFDDLQQNLMNKLEDSNLAIGEELKNLVNFIDSMKSEVASLTAKFAQLESSFMDSLTSGFKDIAIKLDSVKSTCQNQTNISEGEQTSVDEENCNLSTGTNLVTLRNGKKYAFSDFALSWFSAKLFCEQRGLTLVTIKSNQDFSALNDAVGNKDVVFWLSASDVGRPRGQFAWLDGTPLSRRGPMWYRGQAVYYQQNQQSCVLLYKSKLHAYNCLANYNFICQLPPQCYKNK